MVFPAGSKTGLSVPDVLAAEYLEQFQVLPLEIAEGKLRVAAAGDPDPQALDDLSLLWQLPIEIVPAEPDELGEAIRRAMDANESVVELIDDAGREDANLADDHDLADARNLANQPPVIRYVNLLLRDASSSGASDIHLESTKTGLRIRLRLDGVLSDIEGPPRGIANAVVSRIKLLASLDIAERRKPQDGRIRARLEDRELDLRVSTVPSLFGESLVLRLLERGGRPVAPDELGMDSDTLSQFRELSLRPHGIVLVTGPTGSGKTTTLYATIGLRDAMAEKILTVEDPIEYQLPGTTQIPVNAATGVTFAAVLRNVLRQDPNVLMVGEMRDGETADVAIRAALTGHAVFSSLHTNDAVSAVPRLMDLGIEPYLLASTLEAVLAQRLVRKICPHCRMQYEPDPQSVALIAETPIRRAKLERGAGCVACRQTGFKGRTGIFELLTVDEELRDAVLRRASRAELKECATARAMRTLRRDGWSKVRTGITTVEEVLRVTTD
ncbi:MAG: type II/IV secretion system protein [Gemmatimonadetes bacterium]|nr:type II/IV secretion system protein [Gemmatimonadota bacterium]